LEKKQAAVCTVIKAQSRVADEQVAEMAQHQESEERSLEETMGWRRSELNELNCNTRWCTKWQFQLDGQRHPPPMQLGSYTAD
jgi:hypothetical protein